MLPLVINYPSWLKPEIITGLPVRWYGLMYIFAFATAFFVYRKQVRERNFPMSDDSLSSLFFWGILGLLLGARVFHALVYDSSGYYLMQPWLIFWPFRGGQFTGLQGMSYHGGAFAGLLAVFLFAKFKKYNFREIGDMFAAAIPLGYTFGRLGNFINAELYGRATASPLGMIFPERTTRLFSAGENWVVEMAEKTGVEITGSFVNLPRHPSQLYEMIFEGIVLWAILWFLRNRKPFRGFLIGMYFIGYGFFRFFIEYFREPDADLGYRISPGSHPLLNFTTGQILCFIMILFGVTWNFIASRLPDREPVRIYKGETEQKQINIAQSQAQRNRRRKLRKKLR